MWMFDLFPYIIVAWHTAFMTRSWCIPVAFYTVIQFCIVRPIGYGWVSDLHGDIFYTLAFMVFAAIGRGMACVTRIPGILTHFNSTVITNKPSITWTESWSNYIMRVWFKFVLILVLPMIAATLPYELISKNLWFGFIITLIFLCVLDVFFYIMFEPTPEPKSTFLDMWKYDVAFAKKPTGRLIMLIFFIIFDVITTIVWCVVQTVTQWQQFYLATCLAGLFCIELIIVTIIFNFISYKPKIKQQQQNPDTNGRMFGQKFN